MSLECGDSSMLNYRTSHLLQYSKLCTMIHCTRSSKIQPLTMKNVFHVHRKSLFWELLHRNLFAGTQHFTQIVWKETFEMGIARCWNTSKNCIAIVAFYRPAGNSNAPGNRLIHNFISLKNVTEEDILNGYVTNGECPLQQHRNNSLAYV